MKLFIEMIKPYVPALLIVGALNLLFWVAVVVISYYGIQLIGGN